MNTTRPPTMTKAARVRAKIDLAVETLREAARAKRAGDANFEELLEEALAHAVQADELESP